MIGFSIHAESHDRIAYDFYAGRPCMSAIVFPTDATGKYGDTPEKPYRRSQLVGQINYPVFTHIDDGFSTCIPRDWELNGKATIWCFHYTTHKPAPLYCYIDDDKYILMSNGNKLGELPIVLDQWVDWKIDATFTSYKTGYIKIYANGDLVVDYSGKVISLDTDTFYFQIGVYCFDLMQTQYRMAYFQI